MLNNFSLFSYRMLQATSNKSCDGPLETAMSICVIIRSRYKQIANDRDGQVPSFLVCLFLTYHLWLAIPPNLSMGWPWPCRSVSSPRPAESAESGWWKEVLRWPKQLVYPCHIQRWGRRIPHWHSRLDQEMMDLGEVSIFELEAPVSWIARMAFTFFESLFISF